MSKPVGKWIAAGAVAVVALGIATAVYKHRHPKEFIVPRLEEEAVVERAKREPLSEILPAYGVVTGGGSELVAKVAIETDDAAKVRVGEHVWVRSNHLSTSQGRVTRFLPGAVPETGQGIAWISFPSSDGHDHDGEFVWVRIESVPGKATLVVPASAIVTKEHKTWVIEPKKDEKGKQTFLPTEVKIGRGNGEKTEILSGLDEETDILVAGAVGYLYPDFKSGSED